jgi:hypothetical protein
MRIQNETTSAGAPRDVLNNRDLTSSQKWLVRTIRGCQFGRIENLLVRCGLPVPGHEVRVVKAAHLGNKGGGESSPIDGMGNLQSEFRELFDQLARLGLGRVARIEFRSGVPFFVETLASFTAADGGDPAKR